MFRFATVSLGAGLVAGCTRCSAGLVEPIGAGEALAAVAVAADSAADGVLLVGHEPFAHPSLVELITSARARGVSRIGVQTDGAALALGHNAPGSVGAGVRFFEFVFLGASEESHDQLAGRPGAYASLREGVGAVRRVSTPESRVFTCALIRVCRHNADQLVEVVGAAVASGVRAVRLEATDGQQIPRDIADRAHAVATTAGVALFGDGCEHLLRGVPVYALGAPESGPGAAPTDCEVACG